MANDSDPTGDSAIWPACVELGEWTPVPLARPASLRLDLKDVDAERARQITDQGVMSFHAVGCTGCHADQEATTRVAETTAAQVQSPACFGGETSAVAPSFLFHLGDVVYKHDKETVGDQSPTPEKPDFGQFYDAQFYRPFEKYSPPIFAIPGNHDGKDHEPGGPPRKSAIGHFLKNFCGLDDGDNKSSNRSPVVQPYPYWLLQTPVADIIGLYANVNNAGQLDDPRQESRPQYEWLVETLGEIRKAATGRALLLALHYPPYSAATNFHERGDPNVGPTARPDWKKLEPLGIVLQRAFQESGHCPDVVLSAHAHLYQRLTYTHADGRQIPYLIAGAGGHIPVDSLAKPCQKTAEMSSSGEEKPKVVFPPGLSLPPGDRIELASFNDQVFGFLRLTVDATKRQILGEYFTVFSLPPASPVAPGLADSFRLDLSSHKLLAAD